MEFITEESTYLCILDIMETINNSIVEEGKEYELTFSRSGSLSAKASSLLSITEAAATSRGVAPRMDGEARGQTPTPSQG